MSTTTDNLPEYAVTVAEHGDPQPVIDELTAWLDAQSAPEIVRWALARAEGEDEPEPAEDEPEPAEPAEGDPAEPAEGDPAEPAEGDPAEPEFVEPAEGETDEGAEDD